MIGAVLHITTKGTNDIVIIAVIAIKGRSPSVPVMLIPVCPTARPKQSTAVLDANRVACYDFGVTNNSHDSHEINIPAAAIPAKNRQTSQIDILG